MISERQLKWDIRFLRLAKFWGLESSKDPSTRVGAVIVRQDLSIASLGYNGFPRGCDDSPEIYADRDQKYARVVHAEMNSILHAREPLHGYTLYTWPFACCERCAVHVIQTGIVRCVAPPLPDELKERWGKSLALTERLYNEAGVKFDYVDIGQE